MTRKRGRSGSASHQRRILTTNMVLNGATGEDYVRLAELELRSLHWTAQRLRKLGGEISGDYTRPELRSLLHAALSGILDATFEIAEANGLSEDDFFSERDD